jgi:hypothetical protein
VGAQRLPTGGTRAFPVPAGALPAGPPNSLEKRPSGRATGRTRGTSWIHSRFDRCRARIRQGREREAVAFAIPGGLRLRALPERLLYGTMAAVRVTHVLLLTGRWFTRKSRPAVTAITPLAPIFCTVVNARCNHLFRPRTLSAHHLPSLTEIGAAASAVAATPSCVRASCDNPSSLPARWLGWGKGRG